MTLKMTAQVVARRSLMPSRSCPYAADTGEEMRAEIDSPHLVKSQRYLCYDALITVPIRKSSRPRPDLAPRPHLRPGQL